MEVRECHDVGHTCKDCVVTDDCEIYKAYQQGREDAFRTVIEYLKSANGIEERTIKEFCIEQMKEQKDG